MHHRSDKVRQHRIVALSKAVEKSSEYVTDAPEIETRNVIHQEPLSVFRDLLILLEVLEQARCLSGEEWIHSIQQSPNEYTPIEINPAQLQIALADGLTHESLHGLVDSNCDSQPKAI